MLQDIYIEVMFPAITQAPWPLASLHANLFVNCI